ncbi:uncharacterized protein LOC126904803 [Daktulosphaira vitifoliae]|uniref:uncharacterized protein LOC126904803 n=1 Tax=Daktulosphaira vitifoliae TaxID=58002 RepID=UPI0021AAA196|nr:uncharacterized protein LOC126904803 [Daktulosphaira vitifoliae]
MDFIFLLTLFLSIFIIDNIAESNSEDQKIIKEKQMRILRDNVSRAKSHLFKCLKKYEILKRVTVFDSTLNVAGYFTYTFHYNFDEMLNEFRVRLQDGTITSDQVTQEMCEYICGLCKGTDEMIKHGGPEGCKHKITVCSNKFQTYLTNMSPRNTVRNKIFRTLNSKYRFANNYQQLTLKNNKKLCDKENKEPSGEVKDSNKSEEP